MAGPDIWEIADVLDMGLAIFDPAGRVVEWNAWLAAASGIEAPQAIGATLGELFPEGRTGRLEAAIREALESGASSMVTHALHPGLLPLRTRAGQVMACNILVRAVGSKAEPRCLVQLFDITGAVQRERVLRDRQNARYDAVVESAPDAILTLDAEGVIQLANPAAAQGLGFDQKELVGLGIDAIFPGQPAFSSLWASLLSGETQRRAVELVARRKDGTPSHLELSASRWTSDGRVFVTAILRDVNERHAAEAALRRLNETLEQRVADGLAERKLLADLVETTDALIRVVDFDFKVLAVNKACVREFELVYGRPIKVGDNLLELLADHPNRQAEVRSAWERAFDGEEFTTVDLIVDPVRGPRYYEQKFDTLRGPDGAQIGAFQFVYDVTDRIARQEQLAATEEALRQSQKMEAIGQLTGGIAHDFNNMLTGIIGAMDILKRRISAGRYEDTQRFMDAASASANRAAALTHRLLAFARRQPLDPKGVDANQLVRGMEDLLRRTLGEQVKLVTDLDPALWATLSDANQLENALLNLAINARDAMPNGGRLTIATYNLVHRGETGEAEDDIGPGDYTVIRVSDTGSGMSQDTLAQVFDPFFTTKPIGQGTGLGLSMIYGFAKQSRGHVRILSQVGQGTQVVLYLPRYHGTLASERVVRPAELAPGSGETVLLVEDDSSVRLLISEVLRELGYVCVEAMDGQAALPLLNSNARIDLMITDIGLPGLNGRQLAEIARQTRPELKVLFVTGYAERAVGKDSFLLPGMEMVTKPFTLDALALKIREMLTAR